jgi:Predicted membrane protein (DUF2207)
VVRVAERAALQRAIPNVALCLLALCFNARAQTNHPDSFSGISSFRSEVTVREDAKLEVREEILVRDAASFYKRGFQRDLPILPEGRWDPKDVNARKADHRIGVTMLEVTEDGAPVRYEQGSGYTYSQVHIGERNVPLDSGEHRFVLRYVVDSMLSLGATTDMLYWNALGVRQNSPTAEAILTVHLPAAVSLDQVQVEPRVGGRSVSSADGAETTLQRMDEAPDAIAYRATNMGPQQSLSLSLTWPSGAIHRPWTDSLHSERLVLGAPALLFLFYLIAWIRIGPEPKPGVVMPRYEPPEGLSPAAMRFLTTGTTDGRSLAAVIAQLAVRGCLRVEPENGKYKLSRLMSDRATESSLAPEEQRTLAALFADGPAIELTPSLDQRNQAQNGRYVFEIHDEMARMGGKYFTRHTGIIALGVLATFASALALAATAGGRDSTGAVFFTVWILFVGLSMGMMVELSFARAWKTAVRSGRGWLTILPGTAAIAIFGAAIAYMLTKLAAGVSVWFAAMLVALLVVNLGWAPRLKRRTKLGRELLDQIAGFRQFLEKVEQDRMNRLNPAGGTPDDVDRWIPYAIALEVKEAWGDHLAQTFFTATVIAEQ